MSRQELSTAKPPTKSCECFKSSTGKAASLLCWSLTKRMSHFTRRDWFASRMDISRKIGPYCRRTTYCRCFILWMLNYEIPRYSENGPSCAGQEQDPDRVDHAGHCHWRVGRHRDGLAGPG